MMRNKRKAAGGQKSNARCMQSQTLFVIVGLT